MTPAETARAGEHVYEQRLKYLLEPGQGGRVADGQPVSADTYMEMAIHSSAIFNKAFAMCRTKGDK